MFISFEGKDGSGKSTHAKVLADYLESKGKKVKLIHFPRYERTIGKLIGYILQGREEMPEFTSFQMLYVADQLDFQKELKQLLSEGYYVIADRYDMSTIAYHASKFGSLVNSYDLFRNIQQSFKFPDITYVFIHHEDLDVRRKDINKAKDEIEKSDAIMNKINNIYLDLSNMLEIYEHRNICYIDGNMSFEINSEIVKSYFKECDNND